MRETLTLSFQTRPDGLIIPSHIATSKPSTKDLPTDEGGNRGKIPPSSKNKVDERPQLPINPKEAANEADAFVRALPRNKPTT